MIRPENAIRLMTFNIHGCVGRNWREDPEAVLAVIREANADIVALQEVHDDDLTDRKFLRGLEALDYSSIHYGETLRKDFGPYGNVLTSRFPVSSIERMDISVPGAEPRGAIRAHLQTSAGPWRVTATHLGLTRAERKKQIQHLLAKPYDDGPDVILGDLNEWNPRSRNLRLLRVTYPVLSTLRSFPARRPLLALDRIGLRNQPRAARFHRWDSDKGRTASDHRPVVCDL